MTYLFNAIFYKPLYNGIVALMDFLPWADVGIIVILFTIIVKLILFPLSKKAVKTQLQMKKIEPEVKKIKETEKNNQEQARKIMALYKEYGVSPFTSFFLVLLQVPIIIALYRIFLTSLSSINTSLLYPFITIPEVVKVSFLGIVSDVSQKSYLLAIFAAISSFIQIWYSVPPMKAREIGAKRDFKDDLARSMNVQMRYFFPIIVFFISFNISGAIALYWITSNLFTIGQELYLRKKIKKDDPIQTT